MVAQQIALGQSLGPLQESCTNPASHWPACPQWSPGPFGLKQHTSPAGQLMLLHETVTGIPLPLLLTVGPGPPLLDEPGPTPVLAFAPVDVDPVAPVAPGPLAVVAPLPADVEADAPPLPPVFPKRSSKLLLLQPRAPTRPHATTVAASTPKPKTGRFEREEEKRFMAPMIAKRLPASIVKRADEAVFMTPRDAP